MRRTPLPLLVVGLAVFTLVVLVFWKLLSSGGQSRERGKSAVPVEVAAVERAPIRLVRTFAGALEAPLEFAVSAEVEARVTKVHVDLGDTVQPGQMVAELDDEEYLQALAQSRADLAVAQARLKEAHSALEISDRALSRATTLQSRRLVSDAELDEARNTQLARQAELKVAEAQLARVEAEVEEAQLDVRRTRILARWEESSSKEGVTPATASAVAANESESDADSAAETEAVDSEAKEEGPSLLVARRHVDPGQVVSAREAIVHVVQVSPIIGVVSVTERDYGRLRVGQSVQISTDAFPGETFGGQVARIAPVFSDETRQARVELEFANKDGRLKPGLFIRAEIELVVIDDAVVVPALALTKRNDEVGVFLLRDDSTVLWQTVQSGVQEGDRLRIVAPEISGRVITLGQHVLKDGTEVRVVDDAATPGAPVARRKGQGG